MTKLFAKILPSGRGFKFRRLTTSASLEIADRVGGTMSAQGSKHVLAFGVVAITRCQVPDLWVKVKEREKNAAGEEIEVEREMLDDVAMLKSIEQGAGGGWMAITEQDLLTLGGERSFAVLFDDEPADFGAAIESIATAVGSDAAGKARRAALAGKRAVSVEQ